MQCIPSRVFAKYIKFSPETPVTVFKNNLIFSFLFILVGKFLALHNCLSCINFMLEKCKKKFLQQSFRL